MRSGKRADGRSGSWLVSAIVLSTLVASLVAADQVWGGGRAGPRAVAEEPFPGSTSEPPPEPSPPPSPEPSPPPSPEPSPTPLPEPSPTPLPRPSPRPTPTSIRPSPRPDPGPGGGGGDREVLEPEEECARALGVSSIVAPTGGANSTEELGAILSKVRDRGRISMSRAFRRVAGPFPVVGPARWADDWLAPRCDPYPHLHKGVDIVAAPGTPLVAAADGRVSKKAAQGAGGLSVEITAREGVQYYYAHLSSFARGLRVGRRVWTGEVIGFVGDTGNARGTPHLHLEVQPGGAAVPPKPYVDRWLERAERRARRWARALREREARRTESLAHLATRALRMPSGYVGPELLWLPHVASKGGGADERPRLLLAIGPTVLLVLDRLGGPLGADGGYLRALDRSVTRASAAGPPLERGVSAVVSAIVPASPPGHP